MLLGSAAGGGFPQWNCSCRGCSAARRDPALAVPRTQSLVGIQTSDGRWYLVNASPDVHTHVERHGLCPDSGTRGSAIEAVLITNADLDHCLGLFLLREDQALRILCRPPVRRALTEGLGLEAVLSRYCGIQWVQASFDDEPLGDHLTVRAVPARGGAPRYFPGERSKDSDDSVGFRIADVQSGKSVVVLPDVDAWSDPIETACAESDLVLFDGTFWSDDELARVRPDAVPASKMGHLPISGPGGSMERLAQLGGRERVYVHINNTNPILLEDSDERKIVEDRGISVGRDGMMWVL